ncbi:MAG: transporter substrate-binding domain-containing protein [Desulfobacterales bacterium]|nr:transporter substrate-binding domain-containing protein [Desulfobacterales bacterium]
MFFSSDRAGRKETPRPGRRRLTAWGWVTGLLLLIGMGTVGFASEPRRIVVVGDSTYAPMEFADAEGNPRGIVVDIWRLWEERTGVRVDYRTMDWTDALKAVENGQADAVGGFFYSNRRATSYEFSPPFLEISTSIFFDENIYGIKGLKDLHGFRVGVMHQDYAEEFLQTHAPETEVVAFTSTTDMIQAAVNGELRIFIADTPVALFYLAGLNRKNTFRFTSTPLYTNQFQAGVKKGNREMLALVNSGFDEISKADIEAIRHRWTGVSWAERIPWRWLAVIVGSALLAAVLAALGNLGLRRRIAAATADLEDKRRQLEASEKTSRENEQRFRTLTENADDGIVRFDRAFHPLYANPVVESFTGIPRDAYIGKKQFKPGLPKALETRLEQALARVFETGEKHRLEFELPSGTWIDWLLIPEKTADGSVDTILTSAREITDRKHYEQNLRESEEKYRQLFEMESDAIFLIEKDSGRILDANTAAETLYGYPRKALVQMCNRDLSAEPEQTTRATVSQLEKIPVRYHRKKDGTIFPVEIGASHFTWQGHEVHVAAIRDISFRVKAEGEKKRLEAQFHQAQRLESLGTLAGGIAHDFNNLLMGILGRTSLILAELAPDHPHGEHLRGIESLSKSAADLTRQLLGLARSGKYEVRPTDMNTLVKETAEMFGRTRKEIQIRTEPCEAPWTVEVDRGQMEQVFLNLCINAWHAMPGGGSLILQTANVCLDEAHVRPFSVAPGNYVKISVADTGIGMDPEIQQRIFDPFFTTKEMGRGTGLGLASAYGIIKNHDGIIQVRSEKGRGATFTIYLPASVKAAAPAANESNTLKMGTETVMLVDDEAIIADVAEAMLTSLGYQVLTAKSGREAIDLYSRDPSAIDLVVLDMIMPDMSGAETFDALRACNPEARVLLSSGYSINGGATDILNKGCRGFLQKPFSLTALSKKIRSILDAP